jgi:phosphoglycolate phosphatase
MSQDASDPKAIIFDLDGTLIDSIADITECANIVLSRYGYPILPVERFRELVGDGFVNLTRKIIPQSELSPERISSFISEYRDLYSERWNRHTRVYDGIPELLSVLQNRGIHLSVLSNKRDDFTKLCVSHFFPTLRFVEVRGERSDTPIKPAPDAALAIARACNVSPEECLFVGDSEIDIETAKRARMTAVGVLWGFRQRAIIEAAGAEYIVSRPSEISSCNCAAYSTSFT